MLISLQKYLICIEDYFKPISIKYYTDRFIKNQQKYAKLIQVFTIA